MMQHTVLHHNSRIIQDQSHFFSLNIVLRLNRIRANNIKSLRITKELQELQNQCIKTIPVGILLTVLGHSYGCQKDCTLHRRKGTDSITCSGLPRPVNSVYSLDSFL